MDQATAVTPMPKYVSHKEVWALKIEAVQFVGPNGECEPEDSTSVIMHFEGPFGPRQETTVDRPKPEVGWYMVQYEDGYISFSPAAQFEAGYTLKS
jgi:predicted dehydrogenase